MSTQESSQLSRSTACFVELVMSRIWWKLLSFLSVMHTACAGATSSAGKWSADIPTDPSSQKMIWQSLRGYIYNYSVFWAILVCTTQNTKHKTRNVEHGTRNIRHGAQNTKHRTHNTKHRTQSTKHETQNTKHKTQNTKHNQTSIAYKHIENLHNKSCTNSSTPAVPNPLTPPF